MTTKRTNLKRKERLTGVYQTVCLLTESGQAGSTSNIARVAGLSQGAYLRELLWELVELDLLIAEPHDYNGGMVSVRWTFRPSYRTHKKISQARNAVDNRLIARGRQ